MWNAEGASDGFSRVCAPRGSPGNWHLCHPERSLWLCPVLTLVSLCCLEWQCSSRCTGRTAGDTPPVTRPPRFSKGPDHGQADGEMTGAYVRAYVRAHCRSPDAIRGALAACQSWGNLPSRCITPDIFATEMEPNQSSGATGLAVTHSQGGAVNRTTKSKRNWPEGDLPRPNHRDSWPRRAVPARRRV